MTIAQVLSGFALPHALIGAVALTMFWTAVLTRKGSPRHKAVGRVYLLAMIGVVVTAIPLTLALALNGQLLTASFLAYLLVLVAHSCRMAWSAIRWKHDFERFTGPGFRFSAALLTVTGAAVAILGLATGAWLLVVFGLIGPLGGLEARNLLRRGPRESRWWLREHYGAMIGNGIATHIAFLQIGLINLLPGLSSTVVQYLAWFVPLGAGIAAGFWLDRRYLRSHNTSAKPAT